MTYFVCAAKDHYVTERRGDRLFPGATCPARDCGSKLKPAPTGDGLDSLCPTCSKGLLLPVTIDGLDVRLCSFCGRSRLVQVAEAPEEGVTPARPQTGAERVAAHRARKRAGV